MKRIIVPSLLIVLFVVLSAAFLAMPTVGNSSHPARNETTRQYLERAADETNTPNVVNGIVTDYRAIDTLGEATVLIAGATAVVTVLGSNRKTSKTGNEHRGPK